MILSTTDTLDGYRVVEYCGVYHYKAFSCDPYDAINGIREAFSNDYDNYDDDQLAIIGIKLTQLTDYEYSDDDDPAYWFVAYGTGVIIEEE